VILLDVMLRGLSGFDICRKFRADPVLRAIPIILLTVLSDPGVAVTGREAGADRTLAKVAHPETILTAIAEVLSERGVPPLP
jgi:DNA-binding response OmpR family regulator